MNTARIVVLTLAAGAGETAARLANGSGNKPLSTGPAAAPSNTSGDQALARGDHIAVVRCGVRGETTRKGPKGRTI